MPWLTSFLALAAIVALALPAVSSAHSERPSFFPDPSTGSFPTYRTSGPFKVVCKLDSEARIKAMPAGDARTRSLNYLSSCAYHQIQAAINDASNGDRIEVLPGVYREGPSLREPSPDPACSNPHVYWTTNAEGDTVPTYQYQHDCANAQNLIAITGDTDGDGICDSKCNIQIEGTGATPEDVIIQGDRGTCSQTPPCYGGANLKLNGIRADRADGIYLRNFTVEYFDFNGVYFLETNGFRVGNVVSRYSREYGFLSFASDHGIYSNCEAHHNGDSGVYPGSGPNARHGLPTLDGNIYGIIVRNCNSHDNLMGTSATSGNGTWYHHNLFHDNAAGSVSDGLVSGHPGMPPDHSKWSDNLFYSNNKDLFKQSRDDYCKKPAAERDITIVCPSFEMPVGSGMVLPGVNSDLVQDNYFFDNWRLGTMLFYVPAELRGENDPTRQNDNSNNNRYEGNCMGVRPAVLDPKQVDFSTCSGTHDPNGLDFWWDEEEGVDCPEIDSSERNTNLNQNPGPCVDASDGLGNCWVQSAANGRPNVAFNGAAPTSDPAPPVLPDCPGLDVARAPNGSKSAFLVPCATWDSQSNTDPPGCETPAGQSWFDRPAEPQP